MTSFDSTLRDMPDIANEERASVAGKLEWVGMNDIEMPVQIEDDQGSLIQSTARVTAYVNLKDPDVRGIHMSRLYLILDEHSETRPLTAPGLKLLLRSMLESHRDLSTNAFVKFEFDYYLRRNALVSDNSGWNSYQVPIQGTLILHIA